MPLFSICLSALNLYEFYIHLSFLTVITALYICVWLAVFMSPSRSFSVCLSLSLSFCVSIYWSVFLSLCLSALCLCVLRDFSLAMLPIRSYSYNSIYIVLKLKKIVYRSFIRAFGFYQSRQSINVRIEKTSDKTRQLKRPPKKPTLKALNNYMIIYCYSSLVSVFLLFTEVYQQLIGPLVHIS